jgi:hypothetical protein
MVIRINRRETKSGVLVELHGWLSEPVIEEFESLCSSIPGPLILDVSNLAGADEPGLCALHCRIAAGARLEGASPYIRLLLGSRR